MEHVSLEWDSGITKDSTNKHPSAVQSTADELAADLEQMTTASSLHMTETSSDVCPSDVETPFYSDGAVSDSGCSRSSQRGHSRGSSAGIHGSRLFTPTKASLAKSKSPSVGFQGSSGVKQTGTSKATSANQDRPRVSKVELSDRVEHGAVMMSAAARRKASLDYGKAALNRSGVDCKAAAVNHVARKGHDGASKVSAPSSQEASGRKLERSGLEKERASEKRCRADSASTSSKLPLWVGSTTTGSRGTNMETACKISPPPSKQSKSTLSTKTKTHLKSTERLSSRHAAETSPNKQDVLKGDSRSDSPRDRRTSVEKGNKVPLPIDKAANSLSKSSLQFVDGPLDTSEAAGMTPPPSNPLPGRTPEEPISSSGSDASFWSETPESNAISGSGCMDEEHFKTTSTGGKRWLNVHTDDVNMWTSVLAGETSPASTLDFMLAEDESLSPPSPHMGTNKQRAPSRQGALLEELRTRSNSLDSTTEDYVLPCCQSTAADIANDTDAGHNVGTLPSSWEQSPINDLLNFSGPSFLGEIDGMEQDLEYVKSILIVSGFSGDQTPEWVSPTSPLNPEVFEELELVHSTGSSQMQSTDPSRSSEERRQRRLLFDAVNEAVARRLAPFQARSPWVKPTRPVVRRKPVGRELLQEVWAEIHDWPVSTSDDVYDILDDAARRDMTRGTEKWDEFGHHEAHVVSELEKLIFESLVEDVVESFITIEKKRQLKHAQRHCSGQGLITSSTVSGLRWNSRRTSSC